ncbi:MAG TPA: 4-hydroxythreonine-4-phosphate dehydrogenase PdxA [Chitinophagaceae bacterium]|nr:4-hydroxythreonine-4-phosphate dehydrogenase PdxA [Chitinophagaceae bacterium]
MSTKKNNKPIIGISIGDLNGIGPEVIIKTLSDQRMLNLCTPVIFASDNAIKYYRKMMGQGNFNYVKIKNFDNLKHNQVNLFNCWEEDVVINTGRNTEIGGRYAIRSLKVATQCLKDGEIEGLVTAPIHKNNIQQSGFHYTGHTPFLKDFFQAEDVVMLMVSQNLRVAVLSEHIPISEVAENVTEKSISTKIHVLNQSLIQDFGIDKPKIALLGLNPHSGDGGLIGTEEQSIIIPTINKLKEEGLLCFGPYSADGFFARNYQQHFDAVLAMYHDQGLVPFKYIANGSGVNYSAGLPVIRTSPDHGTAFDIAGKGIADETSFRQAVFSCIDTIKQRLNYKEYTKNPLKRGQAFPEEKRNH